MPLYRMQLLQAFAFLPGWELLCALLATYYAVYTVARNRRSNTQATPLAGPPSPSWLWGVPRSLKNPGSGAIYDKWINQYGSVFRVPGPLGSSRVVLTDPKAVAHFYSLNGWTYVWPRIPSIMVKSTVRSPILFILLDISIPLPCSVRSSRAGCLRGRTTQQVRFLSEPYFVH